MSAGKYYKVRLIELPEMKVVSAHGPLSFSPEGISFALLRGWAEPRGLLRGTFTTDDPVAHRIFGFSNPLHKDHLQGNREYGYEAWLAVDNHSDVKPDPKSAPEIRIKLIPNRTYATTRAALSEFGEAWPALYDWCKASGLRHIQSWHEKEDDYWEQDPPGLEAATDPFEPNPQKLVLDIYLPILK